MVFECIVLQHWNAWHYSVMFLFLKRVRVARAVVHQLNYDRLAARLTWAGLILEYSGAKCAEAAMPSITPCLMARRSRPVASL